MAKNTESKENTRVKIGNFRLSHLSNSIPAKVPPTIIKAIFRPIPEYLI